MVKAGITGGIGSGKTTVCRIFETLGVPVFYADNAAKAIMTTDPLLMNGIRDTFGSESYFDNGALNNKHIGNIVFNDIKELEKLNALVHPAVFRAFDAWVSKISPDTPYVLKEAALLFESGSYKMCDVNILVVAPEVQRLQWVMQRDGVSADAVRIRMDKQLTDEEKIKMADRIIYNDERHSLVAQVMELHKFFTGGR